MTVSDRSGYLPPPPMLATLLAMKKEVSTKRSTQFATHFCCLLSVLLCILSTHISQQVSVKVCTLLVNWARCVSIISIRWSSGSICSSPPRDILLVAALSNTGNILFTFLSGA